ncbi:hypothetical protein FA516_28910 [Pseudomonas aeruginosa]|uniref:hypothetical protein n=1 Tax=Pseudomonas aeruginosa TaxID=287 RepID=UPI000F51AF31|nr:hypothetical protein [Pseudomonas aeruginosa]EIU7109937.1 hypothetical protein [Pseudomonas aeruginosa]EKU2275966.1 hypothetical protein [Pseudomonas aeruginosa]EKV3089836.1 hypothetical protein [Pseudomonas aeruginosa]EKV4188028.1 hypothetical protein [Pseudomonas aeruginosa]EKX2297444.1 hypothetical protein [Pseudomonas aeruginosa]
MTHSDLLDVVRRGMKSGPVTLEQLWVDHGTQWHQLGWSRAQLSLWLACTPSLQRCELASGELAWSPNAGSGRAASSLADEMVALLQKAGRPMPLAQLISKLPTGLVVTEPMLRSAAQQDARLELKGPLVKLA